MLLKFPRRKRSPVRRVPRMVSITLTIRDVPAWRIWLIEIALPDYDWHVDGSDLVGRTVPIHERPDAAELVYQAVTTTTIRHILGTRSLIEFTYAPAVHEVELIA